MKKNLISMWTGLLFLTASPSVLFSQTGDSSSISYRDTLELDQATVTATRTPLVLSKTPRLIKLIDREEIRSIPVNTVNDLLKFAAGVDVRQRGGQGMQTDISIRGGTFDQITILLDGINICDPQTGHNASSFPVELNEIERIEILEGPAGRVYGTSSLLGAINIVTKKDKTSGVEARVEGGSYGFFDAGARVNFTNGKVNNSVSGGYGRSDGYSRSKSGALNSNWRNGKLFYRGNYSAGQTDVSWNFGFLDKDFGANTFYSTASDEQFEHVRKYLVSVQANSRVRAWNFRPSVYWNRSEDRFEFFKGRPDKSPYNYHKTDVFGVNLNNDITWMLGRTSFGAEMRNEGIVSTNLGEPLNQTRPISGAEAVNGVLPQYRNGLNRTNISFFLEHTVLLKKFTISAGLVAVKNTGNEMNFRFYPGADIGYRFADGWNVYASYNTSLRMPTFTELYYSVGGHQADKYLKPEEIQSAEVGLKYDKKGITGKLSLYYCYGTNLIDWVKDLSQGEDAPWLSVNHGAINTYGVEPSVSIRFPQLLEHDFFLRQLNLSYNYIYQDKRTGENMQSKYALEYLRNKLVAQAAFHIWSGLNLSVTCRWNDRVGNYQSGGEMVAYRPYTLLDAQLSWDCPRYKYRIFVSGNNLLNITYYDYGNIPQPGIWFRAGISYRFNFR